MQTVIIVLAMAAIQLVSEIIRNKDRRKRQKEQDKRQPKNHPSPVILTRISALQQKLSKLQKDCFQDFRMIKTRTFQTQIATRAIFRRLPRVSDNSSTTDTESDTCIDKSTAKNNRVRIAIPGTNIEDNRKKSNSPVPRKTRWNVNAKPYTPPSRIRRPLKITRTPLRGYSNNTPKMVEDVEIDVD
jgi:hypothetical protein